MLDDFLVEIQSDELASVFHLEELYNGQKAKNQNED